MENRIGYLHVDECDIGNAKENSVTTVAGGYIVMNGNTAKGYTSGNENTSVGYTITATSGYGRIAIPAPPEKPSFMKVKDWLYYKKVQLAQDEIVRASYAMSNAERGLSVDYFIPITPSNPGSHGSYSNSYNTRKDGTVSGS